jgi:hypothetical protein
MCCSPSKFEPVLAQFAPRNRLVVGGKRRLSVFRGTTPGKVEILARMTEATSGEGCVSGDLVHIFGTGGSNLSARRERPDRI